VSQHPAIRLLLVFGATLAAAFISDALADLIANRSVYHSAHDAITALGAFAGFWFAYTGRLARLFRKVP
jgi:hypothetical protein